MVTATMGGAAFQLPHKFMGAKAIDDVIIAAAIFQLPHKFVGATTVRTGKTNPSSFQLPHKLTGATADFSQPSGNKRINRILVIKKWLISSFS